MVHAVIGVCALTILLKLFLTRLFITRKSSTALVMFLALGLFCQAIAVSEVTLLCQTFRIRGTGHAWVALLRRRGLFLLANDSGTGKVRGTVRQHFRVALFQYESGFVINDAIVVTQMDSEIFSTLEFTTVGDSFLYC